MLIPQAVVASSLSTTKGSGSDSSASRGSLGLHCFCARLYLKVHPQSPGVSRAIFCCHAAMSSTAATNGVCHSPNLALLHIIIAAGGDKITRGRPLVFRVLKETLVVLPAFPASCRGCLGSAFGLNATGHTFPRRRKHDC